MTQLLLLLLLLLSLLYNIFDRVRVQFPALPNFLRSSGSGTGSTQPRVSTTEELLGRNNIGSYAENRYGRRDPSR
jgi:hypothetical protein